MSQNLSTYEGMFLFPQSASANLKDASEHVHELLNRAEAEIISFETQPGDCLIFDLRMLHRGPRHGRPAPALRRRFSLRFGRPDTVFRPRGAWTEEITDHLKSHGQQPDMPVNTPLTPIFSAW